jgi:hypothetical protein
MNIEIILISVKNFVHCYMLHYFNAQYNVTSHQHWTLVLGQQ